MDVSNSQKMEHVQVSLNLTGRCNLKCKYCAVKGGGKCSPDLEPGTIVVGYKKIRKKYPHSQIDLNCMGNGEPLLNWKAIKTVDKIKEEDKKTRCFITTNGTLQKKVLELAKKGWIITISYDGINNENLRGKNGLVEKTIKELIKVKAKFLVRMTLLPEQINNLKESFKKLKEMEVNYIILGLVFPFGRYKKINAFFDINKLLSSVKYAKKIGIRVILSTQESCTLATKGYYIMPDGKISICYVKFVEPTKTNRKKAEEQGCILTDYKNYY